MSSPLSSDLAEKVLLSDIRNWIEKVSNKQTLSASARKMFLMAALLPSISSNKRIIRLLQKFGEAGRLDADELAELHAWICSRGVPQNIEEHASDETAKSDIPSGEKIASNAPSLTLENDGPRLVGSRVRYPRTLAEYADDYKVGERTVKRWIADGREVKPQPDLPPLHRPADMPAWFGRLYPSREVPDALLDAARTASALSAPQNHSAEVVPPTAEGSPPVVPQTTLDFSDVQSLGFAENVEEMRRSLAITTRLWNQARAESPPDEAKIAGLQRERIKIMQELRKAENDLTAYQKQHGDLVPKAEVRAENNRIAAAIYHSVKSLLARVRPQLAGKSAPEQDRIWREAMLACFSSLKGAKFTDAPIA